jgi:hypothetical protein
MKELYGNIQYADSTQEVENSKALDVKLPNTEVPANGVVSPPNGTINGRAEDSPTTSHSKGAKNALVNGYTKGHKRADSGYSNGEKKKSLFRRLSLHR